MWDRNIYRETQIDHFTKLINQQLSSGNNKFFIYLMYSTKQQKLIMYLMLFGILLSICLEQTCNNNQLLVVIECRVRYNKVNEKNIKIDKLIEVEKIDYMAREVVLNELEEFRLIGVARDSFL